MRYAKGLLCLGYDSACHGLAGGEIDGILYRILCCQRERVRRRQAEREREPVRQRQRLECRERQPCGGSETYFSPALAGVFVSKPFLHPPSIRPISSVFSEMATYFSVGMSLLSQPSWRKNFSVSSLDIVLPRAIIFCSTGKYTERNVYSRSSRNECSIFAPMPNLSTLGKFRCMESQAWYASFSLRITTGKFALGGVAL